MKKLLTIIAIMAFIAVSFTAPALAGDTNTNAGAGVVGIDSQAQSQGQGQSINDTANNSNVINFPESKDLTTTQNQGHGYRGFAMQPQMTYAPLPSYFGPATRNAEVQHVKVIIMYKDTFTRLELENMLKEVNASVPARKDGQKDDDTIKIIVDAPARSDVLQKGLITMKSDDTDAGSKVVLFRAALTAMNYGADLFLVTAEGAATQLNSFGWGIGLAYTHSRISAGENEGGTGSGGFGISGGHAGYASLVWVQGIALKVK